MSAYTRTSSNSISPVQRTQQTNVEEIVFDDPTLPMVEAATAEVRTLSAGSTARLTVRTDGQGRPVLTFTWETFVA